MTDILARPVDAPRAGSQPVADAGPDQTTNEGLVVHMDGSNSKGTTVGGTLPGILNYSCPFDPSNVQYPSEPQLSYVNYVKNGDFGSGMVEWAPSGSASIADGFAYSGSRSLFVDTSVETYGFVSQALPVLGNISLMYIWVYVVSASNDPLVIELIRDWDPSTGYAKIIERFLLYEDKMTWTVWDHPAGEVSPSPMTPGTWHRLAFAADILQDASCWWIDSGYSGCFVQPGIAKFTAEHILIGDTSWSNNAGVAYFDKVILLSFESSDAVTAPIASYTWDLNDRLDSNGDGNFTNDVDATGPTVDTVYGDDGIYVVTLAITDSLGSSASDTATVTVRNVSPFILSFNTTLSASGDLGLRVAGRKWNAVNLTLFTGGIETANASIERMPGGPDEQIAWITGPFDPSADLEAIVTYEPADLDGKEVGANPVWLVAGTADNFTAIDHHTFNVQQSEVGNISHWNHIEPWVANLTARLPSSQAMISVLAMDKGSDDLTFAWAGGIMHTHFNDGVGPDPPNSPWGTYPFYASDQVGLYYSPGMSVLLVVSDDDGGTVSIAITI
jgi:hypothetical protein